MNQNRTFFARCVAALAGFAGYAIVPNALAEALDREADMQEHEADMLMFQAPLQSGIHIGRAAEMRGIAEIIRVASR